MMLMTECQQRKWSRYYCCPVAVAHDDRGGGLGANPSIWLLMRLPSNLVPTTQSLSLAIKFSQLMDSVSSCALLCRWRGAANIMLPMVQSRDLCHRAFTRHLSVSRLERRSTTPERHDNTFGRCIHGTKRFMDCQIS